MEVDRRILNCDYIRYIQVEIPRKSTPNSQICNNITVGDSVNSLLNSYVELNFEVIKIADNSRYGNGNDRKLIILGPIPLFSQV